MPDATDSRPYAVVVNDEEQYSIWPQMRDLPAGWRPGRLHRFGRGVPGPHRGNLDWDTPLEPEPFEAAWQLVARRHGIMRTTFRVGERDGLVQVTDQSVTGAQATRSRH